MCCLLYFICKKREDGVSERAEQAPSYSVPQQSTQSSGDIDKGYEMTSSQARDSKGSNIAGKNTEEQQVIS